MKEKLGFTIVELLIVIVVIAILATISIVTYNGIRQRAQATAIISELTATKKALRVYKEFSGASDWWQDNSPALSGASNAKISDIITSQPIFRESLQKAPTTEGLGTNGEWFYDSDNDTYNGCSASLTGVNLAINGPTNTPLMQAIDAAIDDGNLSCGKVRVSGGYFLYLIADGPNS